MRQLADSDGAITLARTYDPYGVVTASTGPSASGYGFTGEYQQDGLVYLRARHYAPGMGRFLTRDPSRLEANLYLYAVANPINRVDPTGLFSKEIIEKNIPLVMFLTQRRHFMDKEHEHWGFYDLLLKAKNFDSVSTGYVSFSTSYRTNEVAWSTPEIIWEVNCDKIMIGSKPLEQYYEEVVKKQNEPLLWWRDTTPTFYYLSSLEKTQFIDGFNDNRHSYPDFLGPSLGLWYGEVGVLIDMDGNRYLSISGGIGTIVGVGYMEGYLCGWRSGPSCANQPSSSEIERAITGLCVGGELMALTGINISPICHGANLSLLDWSSVSSYYLGPELGAGVGATVTLPLSLFGDRGKPDRGWRWLIDLRRDEGITYDKLRKE